MIDDRIEALKEAVEASVGMVEALSERIDALEEAYTELVSGSAEEDFEEERQRWIEGCRERAERAAEKRRTS